MNAEDQALGVGNARSRLCQHHGLGHGAGLARYYLASCIVVLLATIVVNFFGNGNGLYSPWHPAKWERDWKTKRLMEAVRKGKPPQVLVLGSSRMMQVQPDYVAAITGKRTFNFAVGSALPVDYLTELRLALDAGDTPDLVILGVDELVFSLSASSLDRRVANWDWLSEMPWPENAQLVLSVLSSTDLKSTFLSLKNLMRLGSPSRAADEVDGILLEDGYLLTPKREDEKAAGSYEFSKAMETTVAYYLDAYGLPRKDTRAYRIRLRSITLFREFLETARARGIEVRVMLLPLNPRFEERILTPELRKVRGELSAVLRRNCDSFGFVYRDFSDLSSYGGDPNEFWDGSHQTPANLRRMVNALFGIAPSRCVIKLPTDGEVLHNLPAVTTLNTD
jgi:hypothetical protein